MITLSAAELRDAVLARHPGGGRLIGLDLGTKTIGIAFCDAGWSFATPDKTLAKGKFARDKAAIEAIVARENIVGIVIGLPRNMDGSESARSQATRAFARNLSALDLPILLWDERWSTVAVERAMVASDISRAKRASRIDSAAAAYILQGAIDAMTA